MHLFESLKEHWQILYPAENDASLQAFVNEIENQKESINYPAHHPEWYKDAIIYSLYVDLFNSDFDGLIEKLDYLQALGVNCLWLLPVLDSPMKDAGFDIRHYDRVRADLLGLSEDAPVEDRQRKFKIFLDEAHDRGLKVIFDIAINHTSEEHPWFVEARKSENNPKRNYYIWSKSKELYSDARIIFKGLCESNWEKDGDWYYFHRFFEFQPDLNYRNQEVLFEMSRNFIFWLSQGVDGFRADAIPYLWKEEGTSCENLTETHAVVKFFRVIIDYLRPDTLLLAEACQKPNEVVKYFGDGNECNAGYHFPLMPQIFKTLASGEKVHVENILSPSVTPEIPSSAQWFTFMRCHDELSLELVYVSEEDRKYIHESYCHDPQWNFRLGQGVSARLAELLNRDPKKIGLAYSIMLSLPGTPIIYYGDEFAKLNDVDYYKEMIKLSGKDDTRFLVRGSINWEKVKGSLADSSSLPARVYKQVNTLLNTRKNYRCFGRGAIRWISVFNLEEDIEAGVLAYSREYHGEKVLVLQNLNDREIWVQSEELRNVGEKDTLGNEIHAGKKEGFVLLKPFQYLWIDQSE